LQRLFSAISAKVTLPTLQRRKKGGFPGRYFALGSGHQSINPMKSKRNLTRFTYETSAFQGWRLCLSRAGTSFVKYFSDKKFGSAKKSLAAAEAALAELKGVVEGSKRVNGKLSKSTTRKAEKLLKSC
jgi:hypothetical protein